MDNRSMNTVDINNRILETRKQTEELKVQLQNLIDSGIHSPLELNNRETLFDKENRIESPNKVQIIKSFDAKHSNHVNKPPQSKVVTGAKKKGQKVEQDTKQNSPKKVRNYDVKEARDYMKKQREKRIQLLKTQNDTAKLDQKKKLQELHKKSLELVTRNVQAKRERSKSREGRDFVRPDQESRMRARSSSRDGHFSAANSNIKRDINRAKSVDRFKNTQIEEKRNPNLLYPPLPEYITRNKVRKEEVKSEEHVSELGRKAETLNKTVKDYSRTPSKTHLNGDFVQKPIEPVNLFNKMSKSESEVIKIRESENAKPVTNILEYASMSKSSLNAHKPSNISRLEAPLGALQNQQKSYPKPKLSEVAIGTDSLEKETKETQTGIEQKIEFPIWLQERPVAYPFNFISCVKRKLQDAVGQSKQSVDVGIQSSVGEEKQKTPENVKTKKEIMEMLQNSTKSSRKSDLRSFISHKCLNLDAVDHLELIPKNSTFREATKVSVTESESDTSKNIPEISSESESRPFKENGSVLNVDRINKLKLRAHDIKANTVSLGERPVLKGFGDIDDANPLSNDEYTSEFTSESDLSKRRDSIISYNSPSYHKQIIYDKTPEFNKVVSTYNGSEKISRDFARNLSTENERTLVSKSGNGNKSPRQNGTDLNTEKLKKLQLKAPDIRIESAKSVDQVDTAISKRHKLQTSNARSEEEKSNFLQVGNSRGLDFQSSSDFSRSQESVYRQIPCNKNRQFNNTLKATSEIHSNDIPEIILPTHSKDIPGSISQRSNIEKSPRNVSETYSIKTDNIELPSASIKLTSTVSNAPRSKDSNSSKYSTTLSTKSTNSKLKKKDKENKSTSSIPTETESPGSSKTTLESRGKSSNSSKKSEKYISLCSNLNSSPVNEAVSKSETNLMNINTRRGCSSFSGDKLTEIIPLKEPTISLVVGNEKSKGKYDEKEDRSKLMKNISLRSEKNIAPNDPNNANEIHLKFEAEIHLLNDFNESLRQFSAVEKAFESLKSKNDSAMTINRILQNRDTQTSIPTTSSAGTKSNENVNTANKSKSEISTINYSRGSFIDDDSGSIQLDDTIISKLNDSISKLDDKSVVSTGIEVSNINKSSSVMKSTPDLSNFENLHSSSFAHMTLRMFEQLIKDEDVRLENLKTILKIREQALLDRTKGELVWLEIQRKHLRETGKLQEASFIKKKQRGILVNHQKEKHEMQRLRQMQKAASLERKTILREQRNLIKHQLSTDTMLSKMKVSASRERRLSGPLKVIQSHSESVRSETSISKRSSSEKDIYSITSHTQSIVSKVSEVSVEEVASKDMTSDLGAASQASKLAVDSGIPVSQMKRTLLMREAALQKRRKAAEELLRWHKKLLEEEKRITELESTANAIISHIPSVGSNATKHKFKGKQLNQLWFKLTGCDEKRFPEEKVYPMSQISLERFCKSAREYSVKTKKLLRKVSDSEIGSEQGATRTDDSVSEHIPELKDLSARKKTSKNNTISTVRSNDYASDFDVESIQEIVSNKDMDIVDQSLNQLIDNFSKIEADLASLGIDQSLKSSEDRESENTGSDIDVSVIETKTSKEEITDSGKARFSQSTPENVNSNINLSIIEEINKSTRDTLNESEQVLLKLNRVDEIEEQKSNQTPQRQVSEDKSQSVVSEIVSKTKSSSSNKRSELNHSDDRVTSDIPFSKGSQMDETTETLSRAREILEKLSQTEDLIKTGSKKSSLTVEDLASHKTIDNLSRTEEILERLSLTEADIKSKHSSGDKSSINEDNHVASETVDNLNKTEEILENLRVLEDEIASDSSNKKSSASKGQVSTEESLTEAEEVLQKLGSKEIEIITDPKSKTEDSDSKLKQVEENINLDVAASDKKSSVEENGSFRTENDTTAEENLRQGENEEIEIVENIEKSASKEVSKTLESDNRSLSKIPSIPEDKSNSEVEDTHQVDGKISTGTTDIEETAPKSSQKDISAVVEEVTKSSAVEKPSDSPKETFVDEELSMDQEKFEEQSNVVEIIEISDDEESINERNTVSAKYGDEIIEISEEKIEDVKIEEIDAPRNSQDIQVEVHSSAVSSTVSTQSPSVSDITRSESSASDEDKQLQTPSNVDTEANDKSHVAESLPSEASPRSKEEINSQEEKEQDSLSSSTSSSCISGPVAKNEEKSESEGSKNSVSDDKSSRSDTVDVKKRVSEIMADASQSPRGDKSPRVQDLYVTTYDLVSPANSPELGSPIEEQRIYAAKSIFGTEAEEILRKQLAIEQEIKLITEQQQKEHLPYMYVREIPNKPPPPYTPPSSLPLANVITIIPTTQEVDEITKYSAKILHKAYLSNTLDNISISDTTLGLISKDITKECYKFVFDICKEMTKAHYKQFEKEKCVTWLQTKKKPHLAESKPLDVTGLERHLSRSLRELFGYEKPNRRENAIIKWSRKKRDHVDEILVMESQAEESQWTNYEKDELLVMNDVTNEIMSMLLKETGEVFIEIFSKQT